MKLEQIIKEANNPQKEFYCKNFHCTLLAISLICRGCIKILNDRYGDSFRYTINFVDKENGVWFWDNDDLVRLREQILKINKTNTKNADLLLLKWRKDWKKFKSRLDSLDKIKFQELADKEFIDLYNNTWYLYNREMSLPQLVDSFLSAGKEDWFLVILRDYFYEHDIKADVLEVFNILTQPVYPSFVNKEYLSLLKIAQKIRKKDKINNLLDKHQKNYYWIENNYHHAKILDKDYFFGKAKILAKERDLDKKLKQELSRIERLKKDKIFIFKKIGRSKEIINVVKLIEKFTYWQDCRKEGVLRMNHYVFTKFIPEIARRTDLTIKEAGLLLAEEVEPALLGRFNKNLLKKRTGKLYFIYNQNNDHLILTGKDIKKIDLNNLIGLKKQINELKGTVASPGIARGTVKVISNPSEFHKMKKGDILVVNNTTPDFVPILRLAKALVAEQGGVTIHAAIISRELKIPCVIGTKIATKVFKDGDLVEVDAEKGIVRKI
jgi:phosphohistidine swiveling domain-containing protein